MGVVEDVLHDGHEDDPAGDQVYVHYVQVPIWHGSMYALARSSSGDAAGAAAGIVRAVHEIDRALAVDADQLERRLGGLLSERRLVVSVLGGFAVLAVLLAAIGIYGLLALTVAQRTHEIAVRAMLGAEQGRILRLVLGNVLAMVVPGVLAGLVLAFWLTRAVEGMLVDVSRLDPITYAGAAVMLTVVALFAAVGPARNAVRVDPATAFRGEIRR